MTVIDLSDFQEKCSGCFACYNACPAGAISMLLNDEGFYYPSINSNCVKCGRCFDVCNIEKKDVIYPINNDTDIFYVQTSDEIRKLSSSGGFFYILAKYVLERQGIVFGAAFSREDQEIRHVSTDQTELERICRSKYVQSNIGETYREIKSQLITGRLVLFSGTPCQVHALKHYLGKEYSNLILADFVCHGVPSVSFFKDTLSNMEKKHDAKIIDVTFREKDKGWRKQVTKFYFDNGDIETAASSTFYHYYLFLHNYTLRKSCFTCSYPRNHASDLTIWDAWTIKNDDDKGTSAVALNSDTGKKVFSTLRNTINITGSPKADNYFLCFKEHSTLKSYRRGLRGRKRFFSYYISNGFEDTITKWYPRNLRISKIQSSIRSIGVKIKHLIKP